MILIFLKVVGDRKGAVFGGLVEAPLRPTSERKYQVAATRNYFDFINYLTQHMLTLDTNREATVHLFSQLNPEILLSSALQVLATA